MPELPENAPVKGRATDLSITAYRLICSAGAVLMVASGLFIQYFTPAALDPIELRVAVASLALLFVLATYASSYARRNASYFMAAIGYLTAFWWLHVTYLNQFSEDQSLGLIVTIVLVSLVFRTARVMALFQGVLLASTAVLLLLTPEPKITPSSTLLTLFCLGVMGYAFRRSGDRAEKALRASEDRYRTLFEGLGEGVALTNLAGNVVVANPAAHNIFGVEAGALVGRRFDEFRAEVDLDSGSWRADQDTADPGAGRRVFELEIDQPGGERRILIVTETPRRDENGVLVGFFLIIHDVTAEHEAESRLIHISFHDELTGLYNRAYLYEEIGRLSGGRAYPVTVIMADIDGLKPVNDEFGHVAGDELLKAGAGVLVASFRPGDVVARIGGDEFAAMLPSTDSRGAESVCSRIERQLAAHNAAHPERPLSISYGVATSPGPDLPLDKALALADEKMYRVKAVRKAAPAA